MHGMPAIAVSHHQAIVPVVKILRIDLKFKSKSTIHLSNTLEYQHWAAYFKISDCSDVVLKKLLSSDFKANVVAAHVLSASLACFTAFDALQMHMSYDNSVSWIYGNKL